MYGGVILEGTGTGERMRYFIPLFLDPVGRKPRVKGLKLGRPSRIARKTHLKMSLAAQVVDVLHHGDLFHALEDPAFHYGIVQGGGRVRVELLDAFHTRRNGPSLSVSVVALVQIHLYTHGNPMDKPQALKLLASVGRASCFLVHTPANGSRLTHTTAEKSEKLSSSCGAQALFS